MKELADFVTRVQNGEWEAYEQIVQRFQDMAVGYSYSILGDLAAAEDVAQEAFINAFYEITSLREPKAFPGWFRKIVFKHIDRVRRTRWWAVLSLPELEQVGDDGADPQQLAERNERRGKVKAAISALPQVHRKALVLYYISGYSQDEISSFLEIPTGTVKTRLHTARKLLKGRLFEMAQDEMFQMRPSRDLAFVQKIQQLIQATMEGNSAQVKRLLTADPYLARGTGRVDSALWHDDVPVLQAAVMYGRKDIVDLLLANGADINERDPKSGFTALLQAMDLTFMPDYSALDMVDFLKERGAKPDLIALLWHEDFGGVQALLEQDPQSVHSRGPDGYPAIVFSGTQRMAEILLDHGADLLASFEGKDGPTNPVRVFANWWANNFAGMDLLRFFLQKANIPTDIFTATVLGDIDAVRDMLRDDPAHAHAETPADYVLEPGFTALHFAAQFGRIEIARLLIEAGANINAASYLAAGNTPLHTAVRLGHRKVEERPMEAVLQEQVWRLEPDLVRLLLQRGADRNRRDDLRGWTPLEWAQNELGDHTNRDAVIEILLDEKHEETK